MIAYLEGGVEVAADRRPGAGRLTDNEWLGRLYSSAGIEVRARQTAGKPDTLPEIYWRGIERRNPEATEDGWRNPVRQAQFTAPRRMGPRSGAQPHPVGKATWRLCPAGKACPLRQCHARRRPF